MTKGKGRESIYAEVSRQQSQVSLRPREPPTQEFCDPWATPCDKQPLVTPSGLSSSTGEELGRPEEQSAPKSCSLEPSGRLC